MSTPWILRPARWGMLRLMQRERIFLSFSRDDVSFRDLLVQHLAPFVRDGRMELRDLGKIPPGADRRDHIERAAAESRVAVVLVSASYLADRSCAEELAALQRHELRGLRLIPVLVRACPVQQVSWLSKLQLLPRSGHAIASGTPSRQDQDFADVAREVSEDLEAMGPARPADRPAPDPRLIDDRYSLVERLGEGGQGEVWRAVDRVGQNKDVAIKLVDVDRAPPSLIERVRREANVLHQLSHPSLLVCHRLFEDLRDRRIGLVMDYVPGASLEDAASDVRMSRRHRIWVLSHLARALAFLHGKKLVHRDIKPENVLLHADFWDAPERPEHVTLIDFGIAAPEGNPKPVTAVGNVIGTLAYMAPESLDPATWGAPAVASTRDIFAFGVLGWRLMAGRHPSGIESGDIASYAHVYREAVRDRAPWPKGDVQGLWGEVLRACLSLRASDRPASGAELVSMMEPGARAAAPPAPAPMPAALPRTVPGAPLSGLTVPGVAPVALPDVGRTTPAPVPVAPLDVGRATPAPALVGPSGGYRPQIVSKVGPPGAPPPSQVRGESTLGRWILVAGALLAAAGIIWLVTPPAGSVGASKPVPTPTSRPTSVPTAAEVLRTAPSAAVPSTPVPPTSRSIPAPGPVTAACCQPLACRLDDAREDSLAKYFKVKLDGTCECPSGRTSIPWCCERWIPRQSWSVRVSWAGFLGLEGKDVTVDTRYPDATVCMRKHDPAALLLAAGMPCVRIADIPTSATPESKSLVTLTTDDLSKLGVDILVHDGAGIPLASKTQAWVSDIGLGVLCRGLLLRVQSSVLAEPKVVVFLDDPPTP